MKKRTLKWSLIGVSLAAMIAIGALIWHQRPITREFYTDADTIKTARVAARVRDVLWQPPVRLGEVVNTSAEDYEPRISWDGLTLFFVRGKAGENADIYISQRTPAGWTEPEPLVEVNTPYEDLGPEPTADGTALYFYSDRPGGHGGYDLWVTRRTEQGWQPATNLGPLVNSEYNDYGPALTPDGKTLYFASNRPQPSDTRQPGPDAWPATVREDLFHRTYDLFSAPLTPRGPGQAQPLPALNTAYNEGAPCVSPVGDFVYFSSDRPGGEGGFDVYRARRTDGELEPPANLGPTLNTPANELDPGLTHLGYAIYFSSDRPHARLRPDRPNDYNLYYTSSREVFLQTERETRPPINWAALWRQVLPNLLWALLALLLLLLLWALVGSVRDGKLSLLARCLLASLMLHLLVMMALNFWEVTASVVTAFREHGEIRVALAAPARGNALAAQICGQLTEVTPPETPDVQLARYETPVEAAQFDAATELAADRNRLEMQVQPNVQLAAREAPQREPQTSPPTPEVRPSRLTPSRLPELALPSEARRIDGDESQLEVQMASTQDALLTRPVLPVPTSQPIDSSNEVSLAPARHASKTGVESPPSMAGGPVAQDAAPPPEASVAPSQYVVALDNLPALDVALPDLGLPNESRRIDGDESQLEVQMASAQDALHTRPVLPVPTSQPVDSSNEVSLAPARHASKTGVESPPSMAGGPVAQDAAPPPEENAAPSQYVAALDNLPALDVALPADSQQEHEIVESSPSVAPAAADSARRATLSVAAERAIASRPELAPPRTAVLVGDFVPAAAAEIAPTEASPRTTSSIFLAGPRQPESSLPRIGLALPALEEGSAGEHAERAPRVAAVGAGSAHPPMADHVARNSATPSGRPAMLAPEPVAEPRRDTRSLFEPDADAASRNADAGVSEPIVPRPQRIVDGPETLVFDLRLPDQVEPPARGLDPESGRAPITGRVTDTDSGAPLAGAVIRLDLPDTEPLTATTDDEGNYALAIPPVPDNFALSASHADYVPTSVNIPAATLREGPLTQDFELEPHSKDVIVVEAEPTVHHLGNDIWAGVINSQFQKTSEGRRFTAEFELTPCQLPPHYSQAAVTLLAKGVQCPHQIYINGYRLRQRLDSSPEDGSFGEFSTPLPPEILEQGVNRIQIRAVSCRGDVDDFEFINIRIRLSR